MVSKLKRVGLALLVLFLVGCGESDNTVSTFITEEEGSGNINLVDHVGNNETLKYTHNLGNTPQDVYFIFTNPTSSDINADTVVSSNFEIEKKDGTTPSNKVKDQILSGDSGALSADGFTIGLRDRPEILQIEGLPIPFNQSLAEMSGSVFPETPNLVAVGSTHDFLDWNFNSNTEVTVSATLRKIIDVSADIVLNLWVEDSSWAPCSKSKCMNATMLAAFGEKFLMAGPNNDIYDWITGIFGAPWGSHTNPAYIGEAYKNQIDILFYDIDEDNSTNGGVLGFFWSKDNAIRNTSDTTYFTNISNQRLMFYIDAVMAATEESSSWAITDEWPSEIVATLAHEFQHMIHFYQKTLIRAEGASQTWLNEMCSMAAEDFVADKILVNGPRGVTFDTYGAGSSGNSEGRLPWFNDVNYLGLTDWLQGNNVYYSYATSYAFGAYLARNYGGALLFKAIVQNDFTDSEAVTQALSDLGVTISFSDLLRKWGAAVLLSDRTDSPTDFRYNTGNSFTSDSGSVTYNVGSINLFNYSPEPVIIESSEFTLTSQYKTANRYFKVGSNLTGSYSWYIGMPQNVRLTIVTK